MKVAERYDESIVPKESAVELVPISDLWSAVDDSLNKIKSQPVKSSQYVRDVLAEEYKAVREAFDLNYGDVPDNDPDKARILDIFALFESN